MGLRPDPLWAVVSGRGEFTGVPQMFQGGPANTALFTTSRIDPARRAELEPVTQVLVAGDEFVDPLQMGAILRDRLRVNSMICIGGPALNSTMIDAGAADELFVTLAPKLQGGSRMATMLEGDDYPPERLPVMELLSLYGDGSELYLRYRLPPDLAR